MLKRLFALLSMVAIVLCTIAIDLAYVGEAFLTSAPPDVLLSRILGRPVRPEQILREALGRDVHLGSIEVPGLPEVRGFTDVLHLRAVVAHDVRIPSKLRPDGDPLNLISVRRVEVKLDRFALLEKKVEPTEVVLEGLRVDLVPGPDGKLELGELIRSLVPKEAADGPPPIPPALTLRDGWVRFATPAVFQPGHVQEVTDLSLVLRPLTGTAFLVDGSFAFGRLGRWTLRGDYDLATKVARIHLETRGLRLGPEVAAILSDAILSNWNNFKPNGTVDLALDLRLEERAEKDATGAPVKQMATTFTGRLTMRGLEMTYVNFAYPVLVETGTAELRHDGFRLIRLAGRSTLSTTRLLVDGEADGYEKADALHLRISLDDVSLDRHIRAALQEDDQQAFDTFTPSGKVRAFCDVKKERGVGKRAINHMRLTCEDVNLTFRSFPYPLTRVQGDVEFLEKEIVAKNLVGWHGDTKFAISGAILGLGGEGAGFDMTIDAAPVALDMDLRAAFEPSMQEVWDLFSPSGTMEVRWRTERPPGKTAPIRHHIRSRCLDVRASYVETPYPLSGITGDIVYEPGLVTLRDLRGRDRKARIEIDGTVKLGDPAPTVDLRVQGKEVPLDDKLLAALPQGLSEMIREIGGTGTIDFSVHVDRAPISRPERPGGPPPRVPTVTDYSGDVRFFDATFQMGLGFEGVYGNVAVNGKLGPEGNEANGQIKLTETRMEGKRLSDVRTNFVYSKGRISFLDLAATAYSGLIGGDLWVASADKRFKGDFKVNGIDLAAFTRDTYISGRDVSGKLSGDLHLEGKGFDKQALTGEGDIRIEQSQLWDVPVFLSIFQGVSLSQKEEFQTGTVKFRLKDGKMPIDEFAFTGEDISVKGSGESDLSGNIDLTMDASFPIALIPSIPIISDIWGALRKAIYGISMTGSFKDPQVSVELVPFLGSSGKNPVGEKKRTREKKKVDAQASPDGRRDDRR